MIKSTAPAITILNALCNANDDDARNDDNAAIIRTLLIHPDSTDAELASYADDTRDADAIRRTIAMLDREQLTATLLAFSLCPLHRIDYAICFDDDTPDCASIRTIHPDHDS